MGRKRQHASAADRYRAAYLRRKARAAAGEYKTLAFMLTPDDLTLFLELKAREGFVHNAEAFGALLKLYRQQLEQQGREIVSVWANELKPAPVPVSVAMQAEPKPKPEPRPRSKPRKRAARTSSDSVVRADLDQLSLFE